MGAAVRVDDPLAGYSPDWRRRTRPASPTSASTDEDPLAGYSADWRQRQEPIVPAVTVQPESELAPVTVRAQPPRVAAPIPTPPAPRRVASDATAVAGLPAAPTPRAPIVLPPNRVSIGARTSADDRRATTARVLARGAEMEAGREGLKEALVGMISSLAPHPMGGETSEANVARFNAEMEAAGGAGAPRPPVTLAPRTTPRLWPMARTWAASRAAPRIATPVPDVSEPTASLPTSDVPTASGHERLTGVAIRNHETGQVYASDGFDGGHPALTERVGRSIGMDPVMMDLDHQDGFLASSGRFVDRHEGIRIARRAHGMQDATQGSDIAMRRAGLGLYAEDLSVPGMAAASSSSATSPAAHDARVEAPPSPPPTTHADLVAADGGERFSGPPLTTRARQAIHTGYRAALVTPYADIEAEAPRLVDALHRAGAAQQRALHIGLRRTGQVLEGLTPEQEAQFGRQLTHDNLEAAAASRAAAADALEAEQVDASESDVAPAKSARNLWYSAQTPNGTFRAPHEMETEPLLQELVRRTDAARRYYRDTQRYGPTSAVTIRNDHAIGEIESLLTGRDGLTDDAVWTEVARRQQHGAKGDPTDFAFGDEGLAPLEFARHEPPPPESDVTAQANAHRAAAENLRQRAAELRPLLPDGLHAEPWFQSALAKHKAYVEGPLTASALESGVSPESLRTPGGSGYLRLFSEDRLNDAEIRRAMDATGAATSGELRPRGRVARAIFGERPEVARLFPLGGSNFRQGPLKPNAGYPGEALPARPAAVGVSGASKLTEGTARAYATDYRRIVETDARDKAVKAARNGVYRAVAQVGRPLGEGEAPAIGKSVLVFDDRGGLVTGDVGVQRFEVSPKVAKAVKRFHAELQGPPATSAGAAWRRFTGGLTRAQLAGMPVEATSHANTLASIVASVPGEQDATGKALAVVPAIGAKAATVREMLGLDFQEPATRALEHRLADIGALRVEQPHGGVLNKAHHWLFGPEGVDVRGRLVLARRYLARDPQATDEALREFVTSKLGNYVRENSGALVNGLQDTGLSTFARFQAARIPSSIRATFGASGLPASSTAQRAGDVANTLWRGPLGYLAGAELVNRLMTGHGTRDNERGHALDVQMGWGGRGLYLVNGTPQRLTEAEARDLGDNARPLFIPGATSNPVVATGLRATGARDFLFSDRVGPGRAADAVKDVVNTGLGTLSPAIRFLSVAATGRTPWVATDGTALRAAPARFDKDRELIDRIRAAASAANPATHAFLGEGGDAGGRSLGGALSRDGQPFGGPVAAAAKAAEFLMPRVLAPGVGGVQNDLSAMSRDQREYNDALAGYQAQLRSAVGSEQVSRIITEAADDAKRAGLNPAQVQLALTRYANTPEFATAAKRERSLRRWEARHH